MIISGQDFQDRVAKCNPRYQDLYLMYACAIENFEELQKQAPHHSVPMAIYMRDRNMIAIAMLPEELAEADEDLEYAHALEFLKCIAC